jgi:hypothetical protein
MSWTNIQEDEVAQNNNQMLVQSYNLDDMIEQETTVLNRKLTCLRVFDYIVRHQEGSGRKTTQYWKLQTIPANTNNMMPMRPRQLKRTKRVVQK